MQYLRTKKGAKVVRPFAVFFTTVFALSMTLQSVPFNTFASGPTATISITKVNGNFVPVTQCITSPLTVEGSAMISKVAGHSSYSVDVGWGDGTTTTVSIAPTDGVAVTFTAGPHPTTLTNLTITAVVYHQSNGKSKDSNDATSLPVSLQCVITPTTHGLDVTKAGSGTGSVASSPAGISCGATCSYAFTDGTPVTLTVTPGTGSTFAGWSGDCTGGTCALTMSADYAVTAIFNIITNPVCGNAIVESPETCDDSNTVNGDGCSSVCTIEQTPDPICGNSVVESGETCDNGQANGNVCTPGYDTSCGYCSSTCQNVTVVGPFCGDNIQNGTEVCDGTDGVGANQACTETCILVNLEFCGDNIKNGNEECDGDDLGDATCSTQEFDAGSLTCTPSCTIDTTACWNDVCSNIDGNQQTVPTGYQQNQDGTCSLIPVDVCPNLDGIQTSVPNGYQLVDNQCTLIPVDVCSNLDGDQATIPDGYTANEDGTCTLIPVDVCPNLPDDQATVPTGYELVEGQCVEVSQPPVDENPPVSTFDNGRNHQIIDTELVSLSLTGSSVDLPANNPSGVASAEMLIYRLADETTMLSDSFFDITYRDMSCLNIPQEQVPIEIIALNLVSVDPIPVTVTWSHDWTLPGRGVYCAIVHATDKATPIPNVEHTGTAGPFAYNPPTASPTPTPTPTPTPDPCASGCGGGGGGGVAWVPPSPTPTPSAPAPTVAGASTGGSAPQGQVLGASDTKLPATGVEPANQMLISLIIALFSTGLLFVLLGAQMLPAKIEKLFISEK